MRPWTCSVRARRGQGETGIRGQRLLERAIRAVRGEEDAVHARAIGFHRARRR
jgi:hypothetical protein